MATVGQPVTSEVSSKAKNDQIPFSPITWLMMALGQKFNVQCFPFRSVNTFGLFPKKWISIEDFWPTKYKFHFGVIQGASKKCHGFKHLPFPSCLTYILLHVWWRRFYIWCGRSTSSQAEWFSHQNKKSKSFNFGTNPNRTSQSAADSVMSFNSYHVMLW